MEVITIKDREIELFKLLKFAGLVQSGGEAKHVIEAEQVSVNGEIETRKRKKIGNDDVVAYGGEAVVVRCLKDGEEDV